MKQKLSQIAAVGKKLGAALCPQVGSKGDALLLRWGVLSVTVLLVAMLLLLSGATEHVDTAQLTLLCGRPFYLEAEATQHPALSPVGMFGLCVAIVLYLSLVLMRIPSMGQRCLLVFMAVVAAALPGVLCVLWDCVFYATLPVFCILLTWLLVECVPFFKHWQS